MSGDLSVLSNNLTALIEPDDVERRFYFHGLQGGRLIARTNCHTNKWDPSIITRRGPEPGTVVYNDKAFIGVGHLEGLDDYDTAATKKLRKAYPQIAGVLEGVPWLWFAGIRIGYVNHDRYPRPEDFPLVLYLNVEFDLPFAKMAPLAVAIKEVLVREELPDVHVEVRENAFSNHAMSSELERLTEGLLPGGAYSSIPGSRWRWKYCKHLHFGGSTLGRPICRVESGDERVGTAGPYIEFDEMPKKLYTMVSSHVINCPEDLEEVPVPFSVIDDAANSQRVAMAQGSETQLKKAMHNAERARDDYLKSAGSDARETRYYATLAQELAKLKRNESNERVVGTLCAQSSDSPACNASRFSSDWGLVDLDLDKVQEGRNMIIAYEDELSCFAEPHLTFMDSRGNLNESLTNQLDCKHLAQGFWVHMNGAYLEEPLDDGIPILRVLKRGVATGVTSGLTNGVEAVVRRPVTKTKSVCSSMILVIPLRPLKMPSWDLHWNLHFSGCGDSGAAVVDADGRFIGQVEAGGDYPTDKLHRIHFSAGVEVSMLTPAWVLMDDIERVTGMKPRISMRNLPSISQKSKGEPDTIMPSCVTL